MFDAFALLLPCRLAHRNEKELTVIVCRNFDMVNRSAFISDDCQKALVADALMQPLLFGKPERFLWLWLLL